MTAGDDVPDLVARLPYRQAEVARRLGVPRATLNRWLTGATRVRHPRILALALRMLGHEARGGLTPPQA